MNTYLVIITTVLVLTQIVRIVQNTLQLHRQNVLIRRELKTLSDAEVSAADFARQREFYQKGIRYFDAMELSMKPMVAYDVCEEQET